MFTLSFDTTTNFCDVSLFENKTQIDSFCSEMTFGQSESLIVEIQNILTNNHLTVKDLNLMAVCTGPGSFTGVRSSIAAARTFALTNKNMALCGINAFESYCFDLKVPQNADCIAVLIETKRDDFYAAYYNTNLCPLDSPKAASFEEIVSDLKNKNIVLTGDAVVRFMNQKPSLEILQTVLSCHPGADRVALTAIEHFQNKQIDFPSPLYLKAADTCAK